MSIQQEIFDKNNMDFMYLQLNHIKIPKSQLNDLAIEGFEYLFESTKYMIKEVPVLSGYDISHLEYLLHYAQEFDEFELCDMVSQEIKSREQ